MNETAGEKQWIEHIRDMFNRIASHYNRMNNIITFGQDKNWRKEVVDHVNIPERGLILDVGTGTCELAKQASKRYPLSRTIACDFSREMMKIHRNNMSPNIHKCMADGSHLPFADLTFDAVISGFLLRNVYQIFTTIREQWRVLKYGGWLVALDTTNPTYHLLSPFRHLYLSKVVPLIGKLYTGDGAAYQYLVTSTQYFIHAETLSKYLAAVGFQRIGYRKHMLETIAVHWGQKVNLLPLP